MWRREIEFILEEMEGVVVGFNFFESWFEVFNRGRLGRLFWYDRYDSLDFFVNFGGRCCG